jgi:hypothetical protein
LSEIRANTISDAAGTGPVTLTKQSAAKIFCSIASNASLNSTSLNVSSWTDSATGSGYFDFTNALTEVSYQVGVASQINASGAGATVRGTSGGGTTSRYDVRSYDGSDSAVDVSYMSFVIHGDLA